MNYYAAREVLGPDGQPSGRWRYISWNDGKVWAVGKCAEDCPGHETAEAACAHYREGLLETVRFRGPKTREWPKEKCAVPGCETEATHLAETGPGMMFCHELCEAHANRDGLALVIGPVGEITASY